MPRTLAIAEEAATLGDLDLAAVKTMIRTTISNKADTRQVHSEIKHKGNEEGVSQVAQAGDDIGFSFETGNG
jgi:hypothetical protein